MSKVENIARENLPNFLAVFIEKNKLEVENVSEAIGCSIQVVSRIIAGKTFASDEMIKQCRVMIAIGFEEYKKLSDSQKESISGTRGTLGKGVLGFASITAVISIIAFGVVIDVLKVGAMTGTMSGLDTIVAIVFYGITLTIAVEATLITVAALGYTLIKGIKSVFSDNKLGDEDFDPRWEIKK